jgi:glutathione reductase (NADPH)
VAVVGAGYIAVELAGIFNALGSETHLIYRHDKVLRTFDPMLSDFLTEEMKNANIHLKPESHIKEIKLQNGKKVITFDDGSRLEDIDCILWAIGRDPSLQGLGLDKVGVQLTPAGFIKVDEYQNTTAPDIYAVGDVCGRALLTPVAIAAGRRRNFLRSTHLIYI